MLYKPIQMHYAVSDVVHMFKFICLTEIPFWLQLQHVEIIDSLYLLPMGSQAGVQLFPHTIQENSSPSYQ